MSETRTSTTTRAKACGLCTKPLTGRQRLWCCDAHGGKARRLRQRGPAKVCASCRALKGHDAFGVDSSRRDEREPRCRECRASQRRETYVPTGRPLTVASRWRLKPRDRFGSLVLVER